MEVPLVIQGATKIFLVFYTLENPSALYSQAIALKLFYTFTFSL